MIGRITAFYKNQWDRIHAFFKTEIWRSENLDNRGFRGKFYGLLRIFLVLINGLNSNNIPGQAAALSYYSLIALGPVIAISMMIWGFFANTSDPENNMALESLERIVMFIAPPVSEMAKLDDTSGETSTTGTAKSDLVNPELVSILDSIIKSTRSGKVGIYGLLLLVLIAIQLLISIENTFNAIWGVRRGRSWKHRIAFYWMWISMGTVLIMASLPILSPPSLAHLFQILPFGAQLSEVYLIMLPFISFALVVLLLSTFYRNIPNTQVAWSAAIAGSIVVALLLYLNNYLSFFYVQRVITNKSLYGAVGIFPVLMIGLYVFWLFLLFGGQVTYSIQNANYLTNREAWNHISQDTRDLISLACFTLICRRFRECRPPLNADELTETIKVPGQIINESLNRLGDLNWINSMVSCTEEGVETVCYQPAKPLPKITLGEFKRSLDQYGHNEGMELLQRTDPLIPRFTEYLKKLAVNGMGSETFEDLLTAEANQENRVEYSVVTAKSN